jgi:hypothetical protein
VRARIFGGATADADADNLSDSEETRKESPQKYSIQGSKNSTRVSSDVEVKAKFRDNGTDSRDPE